MKAKKSSTGPNGSATDLRQQCATLKKERNLLRREVAKLRSERDQYLKAVCAAAFEPVDLDKKKLFALLGKNKPLEDFISELHIGDQALPGSKLDEQ
jgi:hypothetical protein